MRGFDVLRYAQQTGYIPADNAYIASEAEAIANLSPELLQEREVLIDRVIFQGLKGKEIVDYIDSLIIKEIK